MKLRTVPGRLACGAYILHSGLELWKGDKEQAAATHGMAAAAFPFLRDVPPHRFLRLLAAGQIATGAALLAPFVPSALAGAALTGFGGSLVAFYLRAPGLRKPGSVWPSREGIGVSKDVWLLGIGLGLLADAATERRAPERG
ncbi:hypothetical protein Acsp04_16730 [Actinomadura sp. NBRC 104425]|uniref:hypothetical protein n=1 Tax=Actinomadura sp. NBRC 104425 TaxID=3032204 RepID=UPI0024A0E47D|nr:hypothetical protein [Actinomadura sp. NBRC 104425]GLZ11438.1 hypothetical protein Acsp04_16730 [Actinomadura sp. NBRC 104425]